MKPTLMSVTYPDGVKVYHPGVVAIWTYETEDNYRSTRLRDKWGNIQTALHPCIIKTEIPS